MPTKVVKRSPKLPKTDAKPREVPATAGPHRILNGNIYEFTNQLFSLSVKQAFDGEQPLSVPPTQPLFAYSSSFHSQPGRTYSSRFLSSTGQIVILIKNSKLALLLL